MEEEDAAADPYLPYDGGGDTIPLQEIHKRGTPRPLFLFSPVPSFSLAAVMTQPVLPLLVQGLHVDPYGRQVTTNAHLLCKM